MNYPPLEHPCLQAQRPEDPRAGTARDEERKIRAEIARLEAEARELGREFAAARAAAMSTPAEEISFAAPPKTVRRSLIHAAKRSVPEKLATAITAPVSTEVELPGPRYGP
jgi:hypothetical protein